MFDCFVKNILPGKEVGGKFLGSLFIIEQVCGLVRILDVLLELSSTLLAKINIVLLSDSSVGLVTQKLKKNNKKRNIFSVTFSENNGTHGIGMG